MLDLLILIPTLTERKEQFLALKTELKRQCHGYKADVLFLEDNGEMSIGAKRNQLLQLATSKYVAFFDDDDWPSPNYINLITDGIKKCVDCCSLRGVITWKGENPELFDHSIRYDEYRTTTNRIKYERYPNHLNCIKAEIAKQFKFPETNHGEDTNFATQIHRSGLIKTEHYIDEVIYYYLYTK